MKDRFFSQYFSHYSRAQTRLKKAVSRQSSSFWLILPITRRHLLWNLKQAKKIHVNDKIRYPRQTNMSPEHYF